MKRLELDELALRADGGGSVLECLNEGLVSFGSSTVSQGRTRDPLDTSLPGESGGCSGDVPGRSSTSMCALSFFVRDSRRQRRRCH